MFIGLDYCPMTLVSQGGSLRIFEEFPFDRFDLLCPLRRPVLNRLNRIDFHLISSQGPVGVQLGEFTFDADQRFMLPLCMLAIGDADRLESLSLGLCSRVDPLDFCFGNPKCKFHLGFDAIGLLDPSERFELLLEQFCSVMIAKVRKSTEGHGLRSPQRGYGQVRAHTQSEPSIELSSKCDENRTGLRMDSQVVRFPRLADLLCIEQSPFVVSLIHRLERFLRLLVIGRLKNRFSPLECCSRLLTGHFPYPLQAGLLDGTGPLELCALVLESLLGVLDFPLGLPLDCRSIECIGSTHDRLVLVLPYAGFTKDRLLQEQP